MEHKMMDLRQFFFALLVTGLLSTSLGAAEWKTGVAFEKQLEAEVDLHWEDVPLRDALDRLSNSQEIAFFLDRRIDPDQTISISADATPLDVLVQMLAQRAGAGSCHVGSVVYIGPVDTAKDLATIAAVQADFARQGREAAVRELSETDALHWPELTEPRLLLTDLAKQHRLTFTNLEAAVPHDLWRAGEFPKQSTAESLTLLLAGFGATYRFGKDADGKPQLLLTPLPENPQLTRRFPFRGDLNDAVKKVKAEFPELAIKTQTGALEVTGRFEDVSLAGRMLRGETVRRMNVTPGKKVYSLNVEQQPLGAVLSSLEKSLGLKIETADDAQEALHDRVSFSVENASLVELLQAAFAKTSLRFELRDKLLTITAIKK
ncbi:hypothetical protein DSM3645_23656 [Blastopirellula marina DSM 3645]|uniref:DUF4974 domain-containing protein n=2 Tax=Blastopirellula marina TaxID=124 RepID=A3ZQG5_9BACT|nr:hypothetical protein DSM3645_23656 [Blastopirellula marina DSM 3645]